MTETIVSQGQMELLESLIAEPLNSTPQTISACVLESDRNLGCPAANGPAILQHFWSNFEIASLDLWRSDAYRAYFDHLDKSGGFFYERWGDAPVHSIGAALFLKKSEIHFFQPIGYWHNPFRWVVSRFLHDLL